MFPDLNPYQSPINPHIGPGWGGSGFTLTHALPTDAETSPQTAPSKKSARPSTINNVKPKKLSFKSNELPNEQTSHREIHCKSAPNAIKDLSGVPNQRASELSSSVSFNNNDLPGAICEVQV